MIPLVVLSILFALAFPVAMSVELPFKPNDNITLPISMFINLKQEVGYYGALLNDRAKIPMYYPTWASLHSLLFDQAFPSQPKAPSLYDEFKGAHHHPDKLRSNYGHSGVIDATYAWVRKELGRDVKFFVEVGSFHGNSAAVWGRNIKGSGVLLCIDTWDGDGNMWFAKDLAPMMMTHSGQPHIYEIFVNKMIENGLEGVVVPWRISSIPAARYIMLLNMHIDVLYLDSAHELGETFVELMFWYQVLQPGSLLVGDDWNWHGVSHDVTLFLSLIPGLEIHHFEDKRTWAIRVPGEYKPSQAKSP